MKEIKIANSLIGSNHPPFIIAEMSGNHNQSLETALFIVEAAFKAGVDALKLQTYTPDTMTIESDNPDFLISESESLWKGETLYSLYSKAYTPWEWHKTIFNRCNELGITAFSTPFDETSVDFLESLNVPCYKIASFENTDLRLIKKVANTGKPMLISVGMATVAELEEAVATAKEGGCQDIILLKCTSNYPALPTDSNLLTIPHLAQLFNCQVGLSDHTQGIGVAIASVSLGATVIEKHFTGSRALGGIDAAFSLEPHEMKDLKIESKRAWQAKGTIAYGPTQNETDSLKYRRSLYAVKNIAEGEVITVDNVKAIRPGYGLPTKYFDLILGKKVKKNLTKGTALTLNYFF